MVQAVTSHAFIDATLAIFGLLLGTIQTLTLFILRDIRDRLVRLENKQMGIIAP
jgi:hypothetical protein